MTQRRGNWKTQPVDHAPVIRTASSGAQPVNPGKSSAPVLGVSGNPHAFKQLSEYRRESLFGAGGEEGDQTTPVIVYSQSYKATQAMKDEFLRKNASLYGAGSGGGGSAGGGNTVQQGPEIYSPLFVMANLQLPRDRITMNAWNRNFYNTHPLVRNCMNLHATYPISKIHIKCKNHKVEQFFNQMAEDLDLMGILQAIALEYWSLGEAFPYAQLNTSGGVWDSITILNPDYMHVKKSPLGGYSFSMRPDPALLRLIQSNNPDDVALTKQIDPEIVYHVRKGNSIPLDNFHVSHLKQLSSPYDVHGTSMIVSVYKDLMLYDKLRECYSEDTEVLTDQGFKNYWDVIDTETGKAKSGVKIACPNPVTEVVEFHEPTNTHCHTTPAI
jgi:hypothetical protein